MRDKNNRREDKIMSRFMIRREWIWSLGCVERTHFLSPFSISTTLHSTALCTVLYSTPAVFQIEGVSLETITVLKITLPGLGMSDSRAHLRDMYWGGDKFHYRLLPEPHKLTSTNYTYTFFCLIIAAAAQWPTFQRSTLELTSRVQVNFRSSPMSKV